MPRLLASSIQSLKVSVQARRLKRDRCIHKYVDIFRALEFNFVFAFFILF